VIFGIPERSRGILRDNLDDCIMADQKLVFIVAPFAPSFVDFRGALIAELVARGHSVVAVAPAMDDRVAGALRNLGAEPHEIALQNASLNPLSFVQSFRGLRALIRSKRPDVVIGYAIKPAIISSLAGAIERVGRVICVITGVGYAFTGGREPKRVLSRAAAFMLYRVALKGSAGIVFLNPDDRRLFRQMRLLPKGIPTHVLNGEGVDTRYFSPVPFPRAPSFLMIARLLKDKGIREFAQAAKRIKAAHPEVRVSLVGPFYPSPDSLTRNELDELIASGIDYLGPLDDVRPAIAACSVYVLPSYREGTPRSVLEAMSMGRAIITTDAPGCRETVVNGRNGILVRPRDADSLHEAMLRFAREPNLANKMGRISRELVEARYDVRKVNANLLEFAGLA